jgi:hypothetical protein
MSLLWFLGCFWFGSHHAGAGKELEKLALKAEAVKGLVPRQNRQAKVHSDNVLTQVS